MTIREQLRAIATRQESDPTIDQGAYYGAAYDPSTSPGGNRGGRPDRPASGEPDEQGDADPERTARLRTRKVLAGMAAAGAFMLWGLNGFPMPGGADNTTATETVQVDGEADSQSEAQSEPLSQPQAQQPNTTQTGKTLACRQKLGNKDVTKKLEAAISRDLKAYVTKRGLAPGAVAAVGCGDTILAAVGVGTRDGKNPTSAESTPYDLSSVSKHITALGILVLADQGKLKLDDPVAKYLKGYSGGAKSRVTFNQLLRHTSGLNDPPLSQGFYTPLLGGSHDETVRRIMRRPISTRPGAVTHYSNSGYALLYEAGSAAAHKPLKDVIEENIVRPMGLKHTGVKGEVSGCAPTSLDRNKSGTVMCESQDRLARALGGYSGHAGWLMSAVDLASIGGMEAEGGVWHGKRILTETAVKQLSTGGRRGAGTLYNGGGFYSGKFSGRAAGHVGYNGAEIVVDPSGLYSAIIMNGTFHRSAPGGAAYRTYQAVNTTLAKTVLG